MLHRAILETAHGEPLTLYEAERSWRHGELYYVRTPTLALLDALGTDVDDQSGSTLVDLLVLYGFEPPLDVAVRDQLLLGVLLRSTGHRVPFEIALAFDGLGADPIATLLAQIPQLPIDEQPDGPLCVLVDYLFDYPDFRDVIRGAIAKWPDTAAARAIRTYVAGHLE